jgi:atypical dual specificity phosphatase
MQNHKELQRIAPPFPKTSHLPHKPNESDGDSVADKKEAEEIFTSAINVEEKLDGASVGITIWNDQPVIRNRDHILSKGYFRKKNDTTAKMQFRSIWTWFYKNKTKFENICSRGDFTVYGEWMVAQHGILYNSLPDWFIAYDLYDWSKGSFLCPRTARRLLSNCGFHLAPLLHEGRADYQSFEYLEELANGKSEWADSKREGVYIKLCDSEIVTKRFKMVREDYERGSLWDNKELKKNELAGKSVEMVR